MVSNHSNVTIPTSRNREEKVYTTALYDARILRALYQLTLDLINRHNLSEILDRLLIRCADLLDSPSVSIDLLESEDVIVTYAATPGQPLEVGDRMRRGEGGFLTWQAIDLCRPVMLDDYSKWKQRRPLFDDFPIRAILIVPLVKEEKVIGTINFLRFEKGHSFSQMEIHIAKQLALAATLALDNARTHDALNLELEERKRVETALRDAQLLNIKREREMAALEEREYIVRDLHDGIAQILSYIKMQSGILQDALKTNDRETATQAAARLKEAAEEVNNDAREYILGLKEDATPTVPEQFIIALRHLCQHFKQAYHFDINLNTPSNMPDVLSSAEVETQLRFIIREALLNACKHSGVQQANLTIELDDEFVHAMVEDHGRGLGGAYSGPERRKGSHFGMGIMRSRAEAIGGSLYIDTSPTTGTRITVHLPRMLGKSNLKHLRFLLADDHPLFAVGMKNMLSLNGLQVVGVAQDGIEAIELARKLRPDILLMDIRMPRMNGLEATRQIKAEMPELIIIILTTSTAEQDLFDALYAGASGYLLKGMSANEMMPQIEEITRGETGYSTEIAAKMLEIFARPDLQTSDNSPSNPLGKLTDRQRDVLSLVAQGLTYKEIGVNLFITERTVKFHMGEILKRLQIQRRTELMDFVRQNKTHFNTVL
jgi:DNA-binding NarL/FixJ family response regulator/nitrate/nitrite-specific signal transduction histidine kinase